ncbi:MAG: anthranilate synthase component I family protein, partial [Deltaproteobacteria bacterium]
TRPRGETPAQDAARKEELRSDEKELAEHLMIVDLERNDLGKISEYGSVVVEELLSLHTFPTLHHLISRVRGRLRPAIDPFSAIAATFPGGSVTGAPKIRAMEIIAELEPHPRGVYTGSIGYIDLSGRVDLNIAIRTALWRQGRLHFQVGGAVVADSRPEAEYEETLIKGTAFFHLVNPHQQ